MPKKPFKYCCPQKLSSPPGNAIDVPIDKAIEHHTDYDKQKMKRVEEVRELARHVRACLNDKSLAIPT